jgi:ABC-2 type transport system permease protein
MNKFFIILLHTYISKLKSKSFIISTLITTVLIIGVTNIQSIIEVFDKEEEKVVALYDQENSIAPLFEQLAMVPGKISTEQVANAEEGEERVNFSLPAA